MKKNKHVQKRLFPALIILIALNFGCAAVGPNYATPEIALKKEWHAELMNGLTAKATNLSELRNWWEVFNDPVLSDLMGRAIARNLDLKQAGSRVRQARANRVIARVDLYPTVDATGSYNKSRSSKDTGGANESDLYSAGLDADWELDVFGGVRRNVEAAQGDLEASREDLRDVLVSLVAEVGLNYVDVRTYQARLAVAEKNLAAQLETYQLTKYRNTAGLTTELAVQQARYNAESTRSQIPSLRTGLEEALNRMAVLLGEQPGAIHENLAQPKSIPVPPLETAVGVPADILRQRPDVRRSERELAAQTARVGAAVADLYPRFTLSGSIGLDALTFSGLFSGSNRSMSFGPNISFPVFNAGSIRSNIEVQSALQEEALSVYELSVLNALEEVENALTAYAQEQDRRRSLIEAADAARQAAALAEDQYNAGLSDFDSVLDAQRSLLTFQDELAESDGTVTSNLIRLYKALGGGWTPLSLEAASIDESTQG
jgi:NodT family efflux transporter outer membrane factor (OMF) lipoprotein